MLDRTSPPATRRISNVSFTQARSFHLSNGLPIHIIDAGQHEIVRVEFILKSGKWFESNNGLAYFTSQMLLEGTTSRSSKELADIFEYHGAHVDINSGIDFNIISVYVISSKLKEIIGIIKDCLQNSTFPEEELSIIKDIQRQQLRINNEKNSYVAGKTIRKLLYGPQHPYGRALELNNGDEELHQKSLNLYYEKHLLNGIEIIISGRITDQLIDGLLIFNDLQLLIPKEKSHAIVDSHNFEDKIIKEGSLQSSIRMGFRTIHKTHYDYPGLIILNELFGGFFGSRLMKNIREEKGYTYGIHSSIISQLHDSFLVIGTDVKKDFINDTIDQIHFEADRLRCDLVGEEELTVVKNYMLGNFLGSLETSFALADKFKNIHFFNQNYSFYDNYVNTINTITPHEIRELANKYLVKDSVKQAIVG